MTAAQLKASILDQAIRGLLVPQDPKDEPADILLKRIAKEKANAIPKGRARTPSAPQPITEEEKPFDLPKGWAWVRLGDVAEVMRGSGIQRNEITIKGVPCVRYGELYTVYKNRIKIFSAKSFTSPEVASKSKIVVKGDLLVTLTGENKQEIGMTVAYLGEDEVVAGGDLAIVRQKEFDPVYLSYFMASAVAVGQKADAANGDIIVHLSAKSLSNLLIPLPPLAEQKRIVAKVEELLPLVEKYGAAYERKRKLIAEFPEKLRKSILQEAIQGKLVPQDPKDEPADILLKRIAEEKAKAAPKGRARTPSAPQPITEDEKPFDLPKGWAWCRVGDVVKIASNLVNPKCYLEYMHIAPDVIEKGTGVLLLRRTVKEAGVKSPNHLFRKGQLIYSKIRPLLRKVIIADTDGLCCSDMYPIESELDTKYLQTYLLSELYNEQVANVCASRVKMPKINQEEMSQLLLPLPPLAEQKRIVAKVEELLADVEKLKGLVK